MTQDAMNKVPPGALVEAAMKGDLERARALLDAGASPDESNAQGAAALLLALWNKHADVAALLIERGANVNVRGPGTPVTPGVLGATTLSSAICCGLGTVKLLVEKGAHVDDKAFGSMPALIAAIDSRAEPIAIYLLSKSAGIEEREVRTGCTPLLKAVERDMPDFVRLLLFKGADITAVNNDGENALDIARRKNGTSAAVLQEVLAARQAEAEASAEQARHARVADRQDALKRRAPKFKL